MFLAIFPLLPASSCWSGLLSPENAVKAPGSILGMDSTPPRVQLHTKPSTGPPATSFPWTVPLPTQPLKARPHRGVDEAVWSRKQPQSQWLKLPGVLSPCHPSPPLTPSLLFHCLVPPPFAIALGFGARAGC